LTTEDSKVQLNAFNTVIKKKKVSIKQICPHEIIDSVVKMFDCMVYKTQESDPN
jgi:hypothetical protein